MIAVQHNEDEWLSSIAMFIFRLLKQLLMALVLCAKSTLWWCLLACLLKLLVLNSFVDLAHWMLLTWSLYYQTSLSCYQCSRLPSRNVNVWASWPDMLCKDWLSRKWHTWEEDTPLVFWQSPAGQTWRDIVYVFSLAVTSQMLSRLYINLYE